MDATRLHGIHGVRCIRLIHPGSTFRSGPRLYTTPPVLCQKVHKRPDFRADRGVTVIDRMKRFDFVQGTGRQEFMQVAGGDVTGHDEVRQAGDAVAG